MQYAPPRRPGGRAEIDAVGELRAAAIAEGRTVGVAMWDPVVLRAMECEASLADSYWRRVSVMPRESLEMDVAGTQWRGGWRMTSMLCEVTNTEVFSLSLSLSLSLCVCVCVRVRVRACV